MHIVTRGITDEKIDSLLIETLADYAHVAWQGWMRYLFGESTTNPDGSVTIPAELVERWRRQVHTAYKDLPADEKESDRIEARTILQLIRGLDERLQNG